MKEKKLGRKIILSAFIVVICLSWLFWILLSKFVDLENYENRTLAVRPELTADTYKTYSKDYEKYFNDNIPFRNDLVTINTFIDYFIFKTPTNKRVVIGKDDWIFYADIGDGNPISCYQGTNLLYKEELEALAENCLKIQAYLDEMGKEFVIFVVPNKERIYYDKMPGRYGDPADTYRALQIVEYLRAHTDIRVVYPYDELMRAKDSLKENIYYKTDTHWNHIGGYVGTAALLRELGIKIPDITSDEIVIVTGDNLAGDLAGMLNLKKYLAHKDNEYIVQGYDMHNVEIMELEQGNVIKYHAENADPRKIYVYTDSFSVYIRPYIGSQFADTYMRHGGTYTFDDFAEEDPDVFIYETVERYVDNLASFSIQ